MTDLTPRRVDDSRVVVSQAMLPGDANPSGNVHGGVIMKLVDTAAGVAAMRHVRGRVVTARIDSMSFLQPVYVGDLVTLRASVNDTGTTSLEVGVRVEAENLLTGTIRHVSSAYLVFVALDDSGRPSPVPPIVAESAADRRRQAEAKLRRSHRRRGEEAISAMRSSAARLPLRHWRRPGASFALVGHRGAGGLAPENTFPSFELALNLGVDAVEIDVHLSRDGIPVVIHDHTVDRTTDGHGPIAALDLEQIKRLDASGRFRDTYAGARVPTFDEVLAWARGRTRLVIELKGTENPNLVGATINRIRDAGLADEVFLISFDHVALREARERAPDVLGGVLYLARPADAVAMAGAGSANALCPHWSMATRDDVAAAHDAGLAVCVWTVNEPAEIQRALSAGVDAVTSDYPDRVRAIGLADRSAPRPPA